jgi:hypothetical protein
MTEEKIKKAMDEVYAVGFKNGGISMKNKILKRLNTDWKMFRTKPEMDILIKVLKKINRLTIPKSPL